jgi:methyltransferase (TIGR00027 family)
MKQVTPSRTALHVALRRAAHQLHDVPIVFDDPLAIPILGAVYAQQLRRTPLRTDRPFSYSQRALLVARSRYAEDQLKRAVDNGVTQYVLLGSGLDTFAYRNPWPQLRVFEVDHPATQAWKRKLLQSSNIAIPQRTIYTPVDFEHHSIPTQLRNAGFDETLPTFFAWLGVIPYLTLKAFRATLAFISAQPPGTGLVLDYRQPRHALPHEEQLQQDSLASRVAKAGEPFRLFFLPGEMAAELQTFRTLEDIGASEINACYFANRTDPLKLLTNAARFLTAWV